MVHEAVPSIATLPVAMRLIAHVAHPARPKQLRVPAFERALAAAAQIVAHGIQQSDPRPVVHQLDQVLASQALDNLARLRLVSAPQVGQNLQGHLCVLGEDGAHRAARCQLLVRLGKEFELPLIGKEEVALGCVLLVAVGPSHARRHPMAKLVVLKPLDDSLCTALVAHAANGAQHSRHSRTHLGQLCERRPVQVVFCLAAAMHHEARGSLVLHRAQLQPCQLLAECFHDGALARGHEDRDSAARQLLKGLGLLLVPHIVEDDEAAPVLEPPSDLVTQRVQPTTLESIEVLQRHAKQLGEADQPLHRRALLAKLEPENAIAKGAAHARVEGEPVGGGGLAQASGASDACDRARSDDAHHRVIAADAVHEGGAQVPLLWARHVVGRQRWDVVQGCRFKAEELGRPGGEAAALGSRVVTKAAVVDSPRLAGWIHGMDEIDVFRVDVELKLLHPRVEARVQLSGLSLRADCGARLLKGGRRLGSLGDLLCESRAKDAPSLVVEHRLPAEHVGHECPLAQRCSQACGAAAGEHDQLKLASKHMRPDDVHERVDGHNLYRTAYADEGEGGLRLEHRVTVAWEAPGGAAGDESDEIRDADVALHLGVRRAPKGRLDGGGFSVHICEVDLNSIWARSCRLRLGGDEDLGYGNTLGDGDAGGRQSGHFDSSARRPTEARRPPSLLAVGALSWRMFWLIT